MKREPAHMPALDGARGIAILLVLLHHGAQQWHMPRLIEPVTAIGWSGVDLFFVISGFLITGILLRGREAPRGLARFWIRRALRIFPLAYAVLFACWVLTQVGANGFPPTEARVWTWFALYGGNLYVMLYHWPVIAQISVMWSLAIEEQFYFVWPLVTRFAPRSVITLVAIALPMFFVGMLFAVDRPGEPAGMFSFRLCGVLLGFVPLVAASAEPTRWTKRVLGQRWLRWLGERSYGLYLLHFLIAPAYTSLSNGWLDGGVASMVGWILCVCACAELSYRLFERPMLNLRPWLERRFVNG